MTDVVRSIAHLQNALKEMPRFQEELHHHFAPGLYGREMRIPAGVVLVGKRHRFPCLNLILQGVVEVVSSTSERTRYEAPSVFVSPGGTKRAMFAIEDLVWVTVHPTDETDLDKLEAELIEAEQ